jgi:hypothetical protein
MVIPQPHLAVLQPQVLLQPIHVAQAASTKVVLPGYGLKLIIIVIVLVIASIHHILHKLICWHMFYRYDNNTKWYNNNGGTYNTNPNNNYNDNYYSRARNGMGVSYIYR